MLKIPRLWGIFLPTGFVGKADKAPAISAFTTSLWFGRKHDCMDAGGRATHGAVAEEAEALPKVQQYLLL